MFECLTLLIGLVTILIISREFVVKDLWKGFIGMLTGNTIVENRFSGPLWFVYSLIVLQLAISLIENYFQKYNKIIYLLIVLVGVGILLTQLNIPFRISSTLIGFIFYIAGFKMKAIAIRVAECEIYKLIMIAITAFAFLWVCAAFNLDFNSRSGGCSINAIRFGKNPFLFLISGFSGIALIFVASQILINIGLNNKLFKIVSNANIIILAFHQLFYLFFSHLINEHNELSLIVIPFVITALCTLIYLFFAKHLPIMTGKR